MRLKSTDDLSSLIGKEVELVLDKKSFVGILMSFSIYVLIMRKVNKYYLVNREKVLEVISEDD